MSFALCLSSFVLTSSAGAHPGGLAADGCHNDRKNGGRHCHRGPDAGKVVKRPADGKTYYPNCAAARRAGAAPIYRGQQGYGSHLDRDGDGKACE
ncbi:excalibur calcium-binding domain-containing protein [Erythrobacter ani]|nr:excalibur calcium-binding domain-containing protein [Erythrobacter ani]